MAPTSVSVPRECPHWFLPPDVSRFVSGPPSPVVHELFSLVFLHSFHVVGIVWGSFVSKISVPWSSVVFLHAFSVGFQSQVFWGLVSLVQHLRVGVPVVELEPLPPQEKDPYLCGPSQLGCGFYLGETVFLPFPPILILSFYSLFWRLRSSNFQVAL